jgi:hypothetical protein
MQIYYDSDKAKILNEKLFAHFNTTAQNRTTVHLSDTVHCEMKCYNKLTGMKYAFDSGSAARMLFGQVGQELLQVLYSPEEAEYTIEGEIPLHIDIFEELKYPIEIKWSGQKIYRASDIPEGWILQLMGYMALTNSTVGWMVIVNVLIRQLTTFKLIMTVEECGEQRQRISESRERILHAVKTGDSSKLIIKEDECYWCDFKPKRSKEKRDVCTRFVAKVKDTGQDPLLAASE